MLGGGTSNNKVKYSRLAADDDGYIDLQVRNLLFGLPHATQAALAEILLHFDDDALSSKSENFINI